MIALYSIFCVNQYGKIKPVQLLEERKVGKGSW